METKSDSAYRAISDVFDCIKPRGAFYLFPDVADHLKGEMTSADFARRLLKEKGVAVVPGEEFGMPGHIRISYAVPENQLASGIERIIEAL